MKLYKVVEGLKQFFVYDGQEVVVKSDSVSINDNRFESDDDDDYWIWNGVLIKHKLGCSDNTSYVYNGAIFELEKGKYCRNIHLSKDTYYSERYIDGVYDISLTSNGETYLFKVESGRHPNLSHFSSDHDILILTSEKSILFYHKTGKCLWEYHEEDDNLKINAGCIPIVDDVVVVISEECVVPKVIRGFNIHTGEKLWERKDVEDICPGTLFLGLDNMLYGCFSDAESPLESSNLFLTKLNPLTGDIEVTKVAGGEWFDVMPWLVTMHGNKLYYTDNRRGNEIGVIDVEKKELVERMPLNIKKKVTIGAPVVTDDKVYVFIKDLQELRVYEK